MSVRAHADDLGLHPAVDRAIVRAFELGALSGASLLVNGPSAVSAAAEARRVGMPVWLHLALVGGTPLSNADEVPSLLGANGAFPDSFQQVAVRGFLGRLNGPQLRREVRRQVDRYVELGMAEDHGVWLDGHQHLHVLPIVQDVLMDLAKAVRITRVRRPMLSSAELRSRSPRSLAFRGLERLATRLARRMDGLGIEAVPCYGALFAGRMTLMRAREVLASLPPSESGQLLFHPGDDDQALGRVYAWRYNWEAELQAILTLRG